MNKIELILDNSVFTVDQFTSAQIATLNEMVADNIDVDQVVNDNEGQGGRTDDGQQHDVDQVVHDAADSVF